VHFESGLDGRPVFPAGSLDAVETLFDRVVAV
jgi:hypothetical protein